MFANPFYNSLIEYDPTTADFFDLRGDLAESWELSEDGLTYTFALHENATWHDGNPVTAEDVAYSMDRMVDKDQFRPLTLSTVGNFYKPGNARVIDEHTVAITTPFPTDDIIATLAMDSSIIAPKHYSPALEAEFGKELPWDKSLGSGPFKPGKFIRDVSVDLEKNEDYWKDGFPYLDGVKHLVIIEKGSIIAAFKTSQVMLSSWTISNLANREVAKLDEESPEVTGYFTPPNNVWRLTLNTRKAPLDDPRVRQAINLAVHRQSILVTQGIVGIDQIGPPVSGVTQAHWWGRTEDEVGSIPGLREQNGEKHPDDVAAAKKLLEEAGLPDGFEVSILVEPGGPEVALVLEDQLKQFLNITLNLEVVDIATIVARLDSADFDMFLDNDPPPYVSPSARLFQQYMPEARLNKVITGWVAPDWFQESARMQSQELNEDKRVEIVRTLEDFLVKEDPGPYVLLFWEARHKIANDRVKNFNLSALSWSALKYEHLWCDPKC
jgi:peptide/nickel transport system substrate-binding protein